MKKQKADLLLRALLVIMILAMVIPPQTPVYAATTLTVTPLTWNVIGLDSNNVAVGPNHFPIGARVCNTGGEDATTVMATLVWDTNPTGPAQNPYIHIRPGTDDNLTVASLDAGACTDYYFEVEVDRNAAAYNTIQRYHIAVTASNATGVSTPTPRELFVEHLISQSRNSVTQVEYGTSLASLATVANGGTMTLIKGQTYYIKLTGATATNGYEQIESFINFPNTIFQTLSVETTYTVESSGNMASPYISEYGDGCVWENDPNSPNYRSCLNTGKAGGGITVTYQVKILSVPSAPLANPEPLSTLVYDFSGSSYHYNSDFSASTRYAAIVDPTTAAITKSFTPSTITSGGVSRMKITISNPNAGAVSGYNFVDPLPSGMQVATPSNASNTCATTFSPAADATSLSFSGGTVAANGSCTVQVDVTTISGSGTYTNTTNNLYVDSLDTGKYATAILKVTDAPTPPTPTCGVELASWNMGTGPGTPPPTYSFKSSAVSTATAAYAGTGTSSIDTAVGNPVNAWKVLAGWAAGPSGYPNSGAAPYYEFSVDTSKFTDVTFAFDFYLDGNWANSSNNVLYVYSQANGEPNFSNTFAMGNPRKSTWYSVPAISANSTGSSITTFRINVVGQQQDTAYADIDNVYIKGCRIPDPSTITKSFSPNPVAVGSTSTLVFSVANPNLGPSATLTGIDFNDFLPTTNLQGTVVVNNGSNTVTGTGTAFKSQLVVGSNLIIPSTPVNLTGTVAVTNGSYYVTGSGFTSEVPAGSRIVINSVGYVVSEVLSDTSLVLATAYKGATASGQTASSYRRYTVSSIASDTSMVLTTNYAGPNASDVTMAAGLTLAAAPTTTCQGTATGIADSYAIALSGNRLAGLIAVTNNSATVNGTGTKFTTQLSVGSRISINSVFYKVNSITDDTHLTLTRNYAGGTANNLVYTYYKIPIQGTVTVTNGSPTVTGGGTAFNSQLVAGDVIYINSVRYTISAIASDTSLTLSTNYAGIDAPGQTIVANYILEGTVTTNGTTTVTGTNTFFKAELRAGQIIYINGVRYTVASITSNTSLTLTTTAATATNVKVSIEGKTGLAGGGSSTCTVTASVKANTPGTRTNISEYVSANESGANTTSTGFATAILDAVLPPLISKNFSPNPITVGGTSKLTFTIINPNQNDALSGIKFTDLFPTGVSVASPLVTTNTCGGTLYRSDGTNAPVAGDTSIRLGSSTDTNTGTLTAGGSCSISVNVTASAATGNLAGTVTVTNGSKDVVGIGTSFTSLLVGSTIYIHSIPYQIAAIAGDLSMTLTSNYTGPTESSLTLPGGDINISGNVAYIINGSTVNGNTASDTLIVNSVNPKISLQKQINATGVLDDPWYSSLAVAVGTPVYYKFTVENIGDVALSAFNVTDPTLVPASPNLISCSWVTTNSPSTLPGLPVGTSTIDPSANCVVGPVAAISGSHTNTATAHGTYGATIVDSLPDSAIYNTTGLTIVKSVTEKYYTADGEVLHYSFLVTNSGSAPLKGPVTVTDNKTTTTCPAVTTVGDLDNWLEPGESLTCTATYNTVVDDVTSVVNIASASADGVTSNTDTKTVPRLNANFGHLPIGLSNSNYLNMNMYNDGGARHLTGTTYLGANRPIETDGANDQTFVRDTTYDDGVTWTPSTLWRSGTADSGNGGSVNVTVVCPTPSCYFNAWIDWNNDGVLNDSDEHIFKNTVLTYSGSHTYPLTFDIPGTSGALVNGTFYARFRLYESTPGTNNQPNGQALNDAGTSATVGEVEDYKWDVNGGVVTPVTVSYFLAKRQGSMVSFDWSTATETGNVGFNIYVADGDQLTKINSELIPSQVTDSLSRQDYTYSAAVKGNSFYIEDVSVLGETRRHGPFQLGEEFGARLEADKIDLAAIQKEHAGKLAGQQATLKKDMKVPAAALVAPSTDKPGVLLGSTLNLKVRQTGIYRASYEDLKKAGLDLAGVPISKITLTNRGDQVPVYVSGKGKFGSGNYIEFYGQALDTIYTDTNIYTLQVNGSAVDHLVPLNVLPLSGAKPPTSYLETTIMNRQRAYANYAPGKDAWYDTSMLVYKTPKSWDFTFQISALVDPSAPASLELMVWGVTDWPESIDHHLVAKLNGVAVADAMFNGLVEENLKITLPGGSLHEGMNTLQLTLPGDTGVKYEMVNLDRFSVSYQRLFQAQDGRLTFSAAGRAFKVTNLPSNQVVVYRLSDVGAVRVGRVVVQKIGSTYTASFPGSNQVATYAVSVVEALYSPALEAVRLPVDLNHPAQYLIISHPDFIAGLGFLVQARQAQGLTVSVVDVTDLYSQYTYGIFDPQAIKQYIEYAVQNLGIRYVLLVGGDTYDYRNYLGNNSISFIPSLYVDTGPFAKFVPVDPLYTDVDNDNLPDLAIGRFPVRTTAELGLMINKTLAYAGKNYGRNAVFASDKYDGSISFKNISNILSAGLPTNWSKENIHLDDLSVTAAQTQLLAAMNRGTALVTFTGHSGPTTWTFSNLFTTVHAAALTNAGKPFVAVQWGCWNTYYVDPANNFLVQKLLFSGDKGSAAVLGAVTLTDSSSERLLGELLTPNMVTPGMSIGEALQDAKIRLAQTHPELLDVLLGWTLMGDPALVVEPK